MFSQKKLFINVTQDLYNNTSTYIAYCSFTHNNILVIQERQKAVVKCKKTVAVGYQNGLTAVAD